jgi:hypothetical protein
LRFARLDSGGALFTMCGPLATQGRELVCKERGMILDLTVRQEVRPR